MTALEFMHHIRDRLHAWPRSPRGRIASNGEVRRWLMEGAIEINGVNPQPTDLISFPVTSYVWFPRSKGKVTLW